MRAFFAACLVWIWLGAPSAAGPWLRDEGDGFASLKLEHDARTGDSYASLYGEYGWAEKMTLGLDIGGRPGGMDKAVFFSRMPMTWTPLGLTLATELGAGYYWRMGSARPVARPGLSAGRSLTVGRRSGWASVDLRAVIFQDISEFDWEGELTLGLNLSERSKAIVQFQGGDPDRSGAYLKISPAWVWEWRPGRHLELGATAGLSGSEASTVSLGFWHHF